MSYIKHPFSGFFGSSNVKTILGDEVPQHWQSHIFSIALKNKIKIIVKKVEKISWMSITEDIWFGCKKG